MTDWFAYHAPGQAGAAKLACQFIPEHVTAYRETQYITGSEVILVNTDKFTDTAIDTPLNFLPDTGYRLLPQVVVNQTLIRMPTL